MILPIIVGALAFTVAHLLADGMAEAVAEVAEVAFEEDDEAQHECSANFDKAVLHCTTSMVTYGVVAGALGAALGANTSAVLTVGAILHAQYAVARARRDHAGFVYSELEAPLPAMGAQLTPGGGGAPTDVGPGPATQSQVQGPAAAGGARQSSGYDSANGGCGSSDGGNGRVQTCLNNVECRGIPAGRYYDVMCGC
ncbi:MAG: hypothetical protein AB8U72_01640 [Anaplasma ovis]